MEDSHKETEEISLEVFKEETPGISIISNSEKQEFALMAGRKCYMCGEISFDDCKRCGKPACKGRHGKLIGNDFFCIKCL